MPERTAGVAFVAVAPGPWAVERASVALAWEPLLQAVVVGLAQAVQEVLGIAAS